MQSYVIGQLHVLSLVLAYDTIIAVRVEKEHLKFKLLYYAHLFIYNHSTQNEILNFLTFPIVVTIWLLGYMGHR